MTGPDRPEPAESRDTPEATAGRGGPRIPSPRSSAEDTGQPVRDAAPSPERPAHEPPSPVAAAPLDLPHRVLKSLLGAWALAACSGEEAAAVEEHLGDCGPCAEEALRLRDAVGLLRPEESLDLDPGLRARVLESCLGRRPPRIPVPEWAVPYDAETARLDALLRDIRDAEWHAPVRLRWFERDGQVNRKTTVAGVIAHLLAVDGLVGRALGLDDPLGPAAGEPRLPAHRTEAYWQASRRPPTRAVREPWRDQTHEVVRTVSFAGDGSGRLPVPYGTLPAPPGAGPERRVELPLRDAMVDRAFECWIHAGDIAGAVDYPYDPPSPRHLHRMIDLAARMLPGTLAGRRRSGLAAPPRDLVAAGAPGRSLRLEIEGLGGGEWFIALDSPGADASAEREVAHVALDGVEFCRLAAGHVSPVEAAAGQDGDREAIRDVLFAAASLSRL
ncbi:zf-HC2 domain-containing protein [Streptomyces sp. G44]|uniref:zf-HC2 domain-containing protein n=1 Tax=Streptomyces sp. G44 TaxID=2807632 RepID=UPI001960F944|nr:zf-HC2 domain-containing protein [Streptomyces sp. G44]MBM7172083.1 zf-HC2 domain-containing protein [Streptomyces sp. G44]